MGRSSAEPEHIVVCGIHAVAALLREGRVGRLYVAESGGARGAGSAGSARVRERVCKLEAAAAAAGVPVMKKSRQDIARISGEAHHQGVAAEARLPQRELEEVLPLAAPLVLLDGVTDPRNLGAVLRVVRAFGGAAVVSARSRTAPLNAAALRAAAGAAADIPVIRVGNLARAMRQMDDAGRTIIGAVEDGEKTLFDMPPMSSVAAPCWVVGDEGGGIRRLVREHCHHLLRIPTVEGDAGCLNVSTACAVCMAIGSPPTRP